MAKTLSEDTPVGNAALNVDHRRGMIRAAFEEIARLEDEIGAAREKHLEPLSKARTKAWRTIKKNVDIPRYILEVEYKQFKIARDAINDDDELVLDHMRECHLAMHPGEQLDWIACLQQVSDDEKDVRPRFLQARDEDAKPKKRGRPKKKANGSEAAAEA